MLRSTHQFTLCADPSVTLSAAQYRHVGPSVTSFWLALDVVGPDNQTITAEQLLALCLSLTGNDTDCVDEALDALMTFARELHRVIRVDADEVHAEPVSQVTPDSEQEQRDDPEAPVHFFGIDWETIEAMDADAARRSAQVAA